VRVVVPFAGDVRPEVTGALTLPFEPADVSSDDEAYWRLLAELWAHARDVAIVEHDVVVNPGTLQSFEDCPSVWCSAPYPYYGHSAYAGLGCTRFRASIMLAIPEAIEVIGEQVSGSHPRRHWCPLDSLLQRYLTGRGQSICLHDPVAHLGGEYPAHGCAPPRP
jgi:hypothetical protein